MTARGLAYIVRAAGRKISKAHRSHQTPHGRQTVRQLMAHGEATSSIPVDAPALFDRVARKWNVDYAFYQTEPDKYLLFFKGKQADAITACMSEYQKLPLYQPQFEQGKPYQRITKTSSLSSNYGKFTRTGAGSEDGRRFPGNVLAFASVQRTIHPTQKPVELCEYFIRTYTRPGELVADICAGSGTTAVAALNTGRRYICYETAPAIFSTAAQRIREAEEAVVRGGKGI